MRLLKFIMILIISTTLANANCDWATIKDMGNGTYLYNKDCHLEVGRLVKVELLYKQQVDELNKTITLKDLAISTADARVENYRQTVYQLEDRQVKNDSLNTWAKVGFFVLGVAVTGLAVKGASQLK
jgi:hypothetical protein